jgi:hypothetical protein
LDRLHGIPGHDCLVPFEGHANSSQNADQLPSRRTVNGILAGVVDQCPEGGTDVRLIAGVDGMVDVVNMHFGFSDRERLEARPHRAAGPGFYRGDA